jgi:hypothetical protein
MLRQHLKGWSANLRAEAKRVKKESIAMIEELDKNSESHDVDSCHWQDRYQLEAQFEENYKMEQLYWQQRSSDKWILQGDASTAYFHTCAN